MMSKPPTVSITPAAPAIDINGGACPPNIPSVFCSPLHMNRNPDTMRNSA